MSITFAGDPILETATAKIIVVCEWCGGQSAPRYRDSRTPNRFCSRRCGLLARNTVTVPRSDRFWARVDKRGPDECWLWTGLIKANGYGEFSWSHGRPFPAHRAAYMLHHGIDQLSRAEMVCHSCDVRACVNPSHLWLGTAKDNIQDMWRKGRANVRRGIAHHSAKLNEADVHAIRASLEAAKSIAARMGITDSLVYQIRNQRIWRHV